MSITIDGYSGDFFPPGYRTGVDTASGPDTTTFTITRTVYKTSPISLACAFALGVFLATMLFVTTGCSSDSLPPRCDECKPHPRVQTRACDGTVGDHTASRCPSGFVAPTCGK